MNLPKVVIDLVNAQNTFDSIAYANCFLKLLMDKFNI